MANRKQQICKIFNKKAAIIYVSIVALSKAAYVLLYSVCILNNNNYTVVEVSDRYDGLTIYMGHMMPTIYLA